MQVRPARVADSGAIARVHVDSWRTTYAGLMPDEVLAGLSYERRAQAWREVLSGIGGGDITLVAEADPAGVFGFASGGPERENDAIYRGELYAIYLLAEHQGQGVGRQLVSAFARELVARGMNSMLVWVLAGNPARGFYERLGGTWVREKPITLGGATLVEVAYGWQDIRPLAGMGQS